MPQNHKNPKTPNFLRYLPENFFEMNENERFGFQVRRYGVQQGCTDAGEIPESFAARLGKG